MFRVFKTVEYDKKFSKLDNKEQQIVLAFENKISELPYIGKHLGVPYFREKKFNGKRVLFIVDNETERVLIINLTDKRTQDEDIADTFLKLKHYCGYLRNISDA